MRSWNLAPALVLLAACGHTPLPSAEHPMLGQNVSFSVPADNGDLVSVPPSDGRTTVLDFWAPTCEPCKENLPKLVARSAELEAKGARLVLVAVLADNEPTEVARRTLSGWGVERRFLVDRENASQAQLGVRGLPATLIIDPAGKLLWSAPPQATADDVINAVR